MRSMDDLIDKNMGLVLTIVNRFNPQTPNDKEAYIQAGRIGLWKALSKFSKSGGSKFSPYAWNPITWEIIKEIRTLTPKVACITIDQNIHPELDNNSPFWEMLPNTLTATELEIIELRQAGYNFKEMAAKLNCSRSYIKKYFHTAITKIKEVNHE